MSIFSILSKGRQAVDAVGRLEGVRDVSQAVGAVSSFIPQELINEASPILGELGRFRNVLGLGPRVTKNVKKQFDVNRFTSEIAKSGLVPNNRFAVEIFPPEALVTDELLQSLRLRCFAAQLPGKQLMLKDDIRRHGYGMIDKVPHNTMYGDVTLSFIVDGNGDVPVFFQQWMSYIQTADHVTEEDSVTPEGDERPETDYLLRYKNEYAAKVLVKQMNTAYDDVYGIELQKAFPIAIGDQQLAWDQNNSIAILPVTFSYIDYKIR